MDNNNQIKIYRDVSDEIDKQDKKWGDQRDLPSDLWIAILAEEFGEVAKEVLEKDNVRAREELVQVAAVAAQMIYAIDSSKFTR